MMRLLYIWLLWRHPAFFRQRFGDEMLSIFDETPGFRDRTALLADGVTSLIRQWTLRPQFWEAPQAAVPSARLGDGVPVFYTCGSSLPRTGPLISGAILSIVVIVLIGFGIGRARTFSHRGTTVHRATVSSATPVERASNAKDRVGETGSDLSKFAKSYIVLFPFLSALDVDHDGVVSAGEIANAPLALKPVDTNLDGKLTAEECGARFAESGMSPEILQRARRAFMRLHPVMAQLDADHDGEISRHEISSAAAALRAVDKNRDGRLAADEYLPDAMSNAVALVMSRANANWDGTISKEEKYSVLANPYRKLIDDADRNGDGVVTDHELRNQIRRAADFNRDGVVTYEEVQRAGQSGAFIR